MILFETEAGHITDNKVAMTPGHNNNGDHIPQQQELQPLLITTMCLCMVFMVCMLLCVPVIDWVAAARRPQRQREDPQDRNRRGVLERKKKERKRCPSTNPQEKWFKNGQKRVDFGAKVGFVVFGPFFSGKAATLYF